MVSSDFGKLEVQRHLSSGIDCAMAGLATAAAAAPMHAVLRNSRRFMAFSQNIPSTERTAPLSGCYHDWRAAEIANVAPAAPDLRSFSLPARRALERLVSS